MELGVVCMFNMHSIAQTCATGAAWAARMVFDVHLSVSCTGLGSLRAPVYVFVCVYAAHSWVLMAVAMDAHVCVRVCSFRCRASHTVFLGALLERAGDG